MPRVHAYSGAVVCALMALTVVARASFGQTWYADRMLLPRDGVRGDDFGCAVAASGRTVVVGAQATGDFGAGSGAAYVFNADTGEQQAKLFAGDAVPGQLFGASVAIDGRVVIVGAPGDDMIAGNAGAAYVFDAQTGEHRFKLIASNGRAGAEFGDAVAVSGRFAVIGAEDDAVSPLLADGAAYLFDIERGVQVRELTSPDAQRGDAYGESVAISRTTAVVGSWFNNGVMGGAFLFDPVMGAERRVVNADDLRPLNLGYAVAASDTLVAVGTRSWGRGIVVVYDAATGQRRFVLRAPTGSNDSLFGSSIAMTDTLVVVGAPFDSALDAHAGAAYVFDAKTGERLARLLPGESIPFAEFGRSVAISGTTVIVGAKKGQGPKAVGGAAHVFEVGERCAPVDLAFPFGSLDFNDILGFLEAYFAHQPAADYAEPFGEITSADLSTFLNAVRNGCGH